MFSSFFHHVLYVPIYNLLIFLVDIVPGGDVGIAIILATVIVKLILMPLSLRAAHTQRKMRVIQPQLRALQEKHKEDKMKLAEESFALYREHNIRPFSSILGAFIQIPFVIALYLVFKRGVIFHIDPTLVYSFVAIPTMVSPLFLGIFSMSGKSLILALLSAVAQFIYAWIAVPVPEVDKNAKPTTSEDFARMMAIQARFMLPLIIGVASYATSAAVALYFITSSIVGLVQEFIVRRVRHEPVPVTA
jgi:YidC/Oxa1 family membrane protein insertase